MIVILPPTSGSLVDPRITCPVHVFSMPWSRPAPIVTIVQSPCTDTPSTRANTGFAGGGGGVGGVTVPGGGVPGGGVGATQPGQSAGAPAGQSLIGHVGSLTSHAGQVGGGTSGKRGGSGICIASGSGIFGWIVSLSATASLYCPASPRPFAYTRTKYLPFASPTVASRTRPFDPFAFATGWLY